MDDGAVVLVTGGTGHLGGHTIVRLLQDGHRVRTTVRSPEKEARVRAAVGDPAHLEVVVADLTADEGWDDAMAGVSHVHHIASPLPEQRDDITDDEVVRPARDGALRALAAARAAGVSRVVLTSSFAAIGYGAVPQVDYTEEDWTDPADPNTAYIRSKAIAERAAWDFVREGGPELTVVNPVAIFGPVLDDHLSVSVGLVRAMLDGNLPVVPRLYFGVVDVRDVVDLHVRAMTHPSAAGERFLAVSGRSISLLELARFLADRGLGAGGDTVELTEEQMRAAADADPVIREAVKRLGHIPAISNAKAAALLGWRPRDTVTTILDTVTSLSRTSTREK